MPPDDKRQPIPSPLPDWAARLGAALKVERQMHKDCMRKLSRERTYSKQLEAKLVTLLEQQQLLLGDTGGEFDA